MEQVMRQSEQAGALGTLLGRVFQQTFMEAISQTPEGQGAKAARITNRNQLGGRQEQHRKGAFGVAQHFGYRFGNTGRMRSRDACSSASAPASCSA